MNTLDFLQRVLPASGHYVKVAIQGDRVSHKFVDTIADLDQAIAVGRSKNENIYYAVASFVEPARRKQENVHLLKSFFVDVDCGPDKPYATWKDGLKALLEYMKAVELPKPMVVSSGNGLHVYWVLDADVAPDTWKPIANALKKSLADHGFNVDMTVPADSARILRPVGTKNPKGGNSVTLLIDAPPTSLDVMREKLTPYMKAQRTLSVAHTRKHTLLDNLAVKQNFPPAQAHVVQSKCAQVDWAVKNQSKVSEPLWYAILGVAAHCENPEQVAVEWSKNHPSYDYDQTMAKMQHWKNATTGPATCTKLQGERPSGCDKCPFKGKIGSPVTLGVVHKEVDVAQDAPDETAFVVPMPKGFKRTDYGIKYTIDESDIDVCPFDVYPVAYGYDEVLGYEVCHYKWNRPHKGWQDLKLRQAYLNDENREFPNAIADKGILLNSKSQTEIFRIMLRSYMNELRQIKTMTNLYNTMGWKENYSQFLLGTTIIYTNTQGAVIQEQIGLAGHTDNLAAEYDTGGTRDEQIKLTSIFEKANFPIHMFAYGLSLAAPLFVFTGIDGMVINLFGPSGSGKTLAQYFAQSIWGRPRTLHFNGKFTLNALFGRLGFHSNLLMSIDEATMISPKDVGDFIYWVSQGKDKARLNRNSEEREAKTWSLPVLTSANNSFGAMLVQGSRMEADAQQARLLDIPMTPHPLFTKNTDLGLRIYNAVNSHYGWIGREFITHLVAMGAEAIKEAIRLHRDKFAKKYNFQFTGQERFWETSIMLSDFALEMARDLGLIQFDHTKGTTAILNYVDSTRQQVKDNQIDAFDLVAEYLNENLSETLTVIHTQGQRPTPDFNRMPNRSINVRVDVYRPNISAPFDSGTILLNKKPFREWMAKRNTDFNQWKRELDAHGVIIPVNNNKAYLGKDTSMKLPQTYVVGITLNHARLEGVLKEVEEAVDNAAFSRLTVVK